MRHSASRPTRIHTHDHNYRRLATSTAAAATASDLALQQVQKPAHQRTTPPWLDMEAGSRILALLTIYCPPLGFRLNNQPPYRGSYPLRIHTMPYDLTETDERQLATELAEDFSDYIANELCDELYELAADLLRRHGADPGTDYGRDLIQDLANRIKITTR